MLRRLTVHTQDVAGSQASINELEAPKVGVTLTSGDQDYLRLASEEFGSIPDEADRGAWAEGLHRSHNQPSKAFSFAGKQSATRPSGNRSAL